MKKVGIITLNGYINYGNRLQNYALQEVLRDLGFSVETIIVDNSNLHTSNNLKKAFIFIKNILYKSKKMIIDRKSSQYKDKRIRKFKDFSNDYISETTYTISNNKINKEVEKFDYFVVGSDQVWNPYYNNRSPIYFLEFAPKKKRIAYAPSFGIDTIPYEYSESYKRWIQQIEHISVREDAGAIIIKQLTGRDALVLVDPTLLLTKEKWINISKQAQNKPKIKYLLTYFLGGVPGQYKQQVQEIAKENNLEIVNLGDINDIETYMADPSEFIDFINDCSIFCTDSFHGVVFSILLEKPFVVYERVGSASMYSRITTLLDKFDLNTRKAEFVNSKDIFDIDFSNIPEVLEKERNKSFAYLKHALGVKDE